MRNIISSDVDIFYSTSKTLISNQLEHDESITNEHFCDNNYQFNLTTNSISGEIKISEDDSHLNIKTCPLLHQLIPHHLRDYALLGNFKIK